MCLKKVVFIAPHPDDEINLGGQLILSLGKLSIDIFIIYTTNGDATAKQGNKRMMEAVRALKVLGVKKDHVMFLGYANEWQGKHHLYNCEENEEICSYLGKIETNGTDEIKDYCFLRNDFHHKFTRHNFKADMKAAIEEIKADLIICVDYDRHPDHRAASLMFEEVMGEILKKNLDYRPVVLKKYAYNGVWGGIKDYHTVPFQPTINQVGGFNYAGMTHELESPNFLWQERLSFETPPETHTQILRKNVLYKAAKKHKSTTAWYMMQRVINADVVYWWRPTENLSFIADMEALSGETAYVNDFKIYDSGNILDQNEPFEGKEFCWRPVDEAKVLKMYFNQKVNIKEIHIYEDCHEWNHIKKLRIHAGEQVIFCEPCINGANTKIILDKSVKLDYMEFQIKEWTGSPGISEIEIFSKEQDFEELNFPLKRFTCNDTTKGEIRIRQRIERYMFKIRFFFRFMILDKIKNM